MKQALDKFGKDGSVEFFIRQFVENQMTKSKNAADSFEKNNYPFHVLLDESNEVISSFKVSGIPTKFFHR
jgi:hypothetical protein